MRHGRNFNYLGISCLTEEILIDGSGMLPLLFFLGNINTRINIIIIKFRSKHPVHNHIPEMKMEITHRVP